MASESTEEGAVTVALPPELDEWLDERAATLGVDREELVHQLLASYRMTTDRDDTESMAALSDVDRTVEEALGDRLDAVVAAAVDDAIDGRIPPAVESAVGDRLPDITDAVEGRLDPRFESVEDDFQAKIEDVRSRVVQLKRELDGKAAADHDHEEFAAIEDLESEVTSLHRELAAARDELEDDITDQSARIDDVERHIEGVDDRIDDVEEKLTRVAWVVNDLRDDQGGRDAHQKAVDRIKRAAAQEGISSASCENCGESVDIGLLTDPQCPHCGSTVSDVRPEGGILRKKARLVTAAQLEAGPTDE
ncbi:ribbon-helix-helix protein, CopG family [Halomicroarcula sp. S1AR25-4]|uniref:ribbon-helix-helix protein, CopG family n=1 Tax=Haloarcula sp. S1AR25-4 TaxID=2950538 RepID=UPI002875CAEA|nr:ribbon-helix-helix protein, CopG family [Halomicroarcula sp. S1AR25-4]MDS0278220.1 ribbon-helix-helix protein, CopG family [Halomicroarcula sp. S1AR25-4]